MALQRLVTPAPHALRAVASVPFFIDDSGDPDAEVEAQAEEPSLKQHVPAEQRAVPEVDAALDPGVGELVLADQTACGPVCAGRAAEAEPGADAGSAARQEPLLIQRMAQFGTRSAVRTATGPSWAGTASAPRLLFFPP